MSKDFTTSAKPRFHDISSINRKGAKQASKLAAEEAAPIGNKEGKNKFFAGLSWVADAADRAVVSALWVPPEEEQKPKKSSGRQRDPASGVPANGVPATGIPPATGVPPATGLLASGVPANGAPASGVPTTGVPATGVTATDVPARKVAPDRREDKPVAEAPRSNLDTISPSAAPLRANSAPQTLEPPPHSTPTEHSSDMVLESVPRGVSLDHEAAPSKPQPARVAGINAASLANRIPSHDPRPRVASDNDRNQVSRVSIAEAEGYVAQVDPTLGPAPRPCRGGVMPAVPHSAAGDTALDIDCIGLDDDEELDDAPAPGGPANAQDPRNVDKTSESLVEAEDFVLADQTDRERELQEQAELELQRLKEVPDLEKTAAEIYMLKALELQRLAEAPDPPSPTAAADTICTVLETRSAVSSEPVESKRPEDAKATEGQSPSSGKEKLRLKMEERRAKVEALSQGTDAELEVAFDIAVAHAEELSVDEGASSNSVPLDESREIATSAEDASVKEAATSIPWPWRQKDTVDGESSPKATPAASSTTSTTTATAEVDVDRHRAPVAKLSLSIASAKKEKHPPKQDWRYFAQQKLQGKEPQAISPKADGAPKLKNILQDVPGAREVAPRSSSEQ